MSGTAKNLIWILALSLVIGLIGVELHKSNQARRAEEAQEKERPTPKEVARQHQIDDLRSRTNPLTTWRDEFLNSRVFLFTADVKQVLVRDDGRPLLFDDATVEDVVQQGEEYFCHFSATLKSGRNGRSTVRLTLLCDPSMVKELLSRREGRNYAVVARISAVSSYDEITNLDASGEYFTDRRFRVSGTEVGQEYLTPFDRLELFQIKVREAEEAIKANGR